MDAPNMKTFWDAAYSLQNSKISFVVITLLSSRGSAPQDAGAKAIVTEKGLYWGTVGGGKVEARAIITAENIIKNKKSLNPLTLTWNLQKDIGMTCGGEISYLFEFHPSIQWSIAVFGAGHVAQALCRILIHLPCHITCIDSRNEWLDKLPSAENLKKIISANPADIVESLSEHLNEKTYYVVMTQGHAVDLPILEKVFSTYPTAPFIGTIGSKLKGLKLRGALQDFGIDPQFLKKLQCPIGLKIGSNHPYEIAVSVSAQLLQVRDQQLALAEDIKNNTNKNYLLDF